MNIIVTLSNNNGMLFNKRRQSRDGILVNRMFELIGDKKLNINGFSWQMLGNRKENINLSEDFLKNAKSGDFCFVENKNLKDFEDKIEKIYVFQWNRDYPADFFFDIDLEGGKWKNTYVEEFAGSSHENITLLIYERI